MTEKFLVDIQPGSSILGTYRNQSYKIESALAEFIDNSTQSFFSNKETLKNLGQRSCTINIEIYPEYIQIYDNAYGMEIDDFRRALKLDSPPEDRSGRSEKGMGLKTSATCLGSLWSVETTQYGSKNKYFAEVDVEYITKTSPQNITARKEDCDSNEHYTIIKIMSLNKKISASKINSLIGLLAEMYSLDILNGDLVMTINKEPLKYEQPQLWINQESGTAYKISFEREFTLDGRQYSFNGWVGIREKADTEFSGLTLFRKGRAIKMHYRPTKLLGKPNLYPYQRIVGDIYLLGDNWEPSYTKDELMWEGELEDRFIEEVKSAAKFIIAKSAELRKEDKPISQKKQKQIASNVSKSFETVDTEAIEQIISSNAEIIQAVDAATTPQDSNENEFEEVKLELQGSCYTFKVKFIKDTFNDWIKLNVLSDPNAYELTINYGLPYFDKFAKDDKNLEFMQKMAITISLSILVSKNYGNRDSYKILGIINTIVRSVK